MKTIIFLISFLLIVIFSSCKKENMINKKMEGTWTLSEIKLKTRTVSDFSSEKRTLQFFKYKNAYTRTMKGIYRVDYLNSSKLPIIDTFEYQLKANELDITKVKNSYVNGSFSNSYVFLKRRFSLDEYKKNTLMLVRKDTTDLYIKATK